LGVRQCQRLFRQFGFRLRKPRPLIAKANPSLQKAHKKKTPGADAGRRRRSLAEARGDGLIRVTRNSITIADGLMASSQNISIFSK
jgi:hypothetical protein